VGREVLANARSEPWDGVVLLSILAGVNLRGSLSLGMLFPGRRGNGAALWSSTIRS
jgi:hypothetical protein